MVHLARVKTDRDLSEQNKDLPKIEDLDIGVPGENEFTANVYGSRFAAQDLPRHEIPEQEMPRDVAYRMIKDDLTLDGTPTLKYAVCHFTSRQAQRY